MPNNTVVQTDILDIIRFQDGKIIQVVEFAEPGSNPQVKFGAFVSFMDEDGGETKTYRIVGDLEADLQQGRISLSSPLARAFMGKREGDTVEVRVPKGTVEYTITEVKYHA